MQLDVFGLYTRLVSHGILAHKMAHGHAVARFNVLIKVMSSLAQEEFSSLSFVYREIWLSSIFAHSTEWETYADNNDYIWDSESAGLALTWDEAEARFSSQI